MQTKIIITIILLSLLSVFTTIIGLLLARKLAKKKTAVVIGLGFSAGMMLTISFLELIPRAATAVNTLHSIIALVLGFVILLILHNVIPHIHLFRENGFNSKLTIIALMVTVGMILHDFPEGFALASSYFYQSSVGILVAVSLALHNIPEQFAMAVPLILSKNKKIIITLVAMSALAEPMGAIIGIGAISIAPKLNPLFMAFAAGAMIFVSMDELLPLAKTFKKTHLFLFGIGLSLLTYLALTLTIGSH